MRTWFHLCSIGSVTALALAATAASAAPSVPGLIAENAGERVTVRGEHFRLACEAARGGQIADLQVSDGTTFRRVLGGDGRACPALLIEGVGDAFAPAKCRGSRIEQFEATGDKATWAVVSGSRDENDASAPWRVTLRYEVHAEGAVFIDMECELLAQTWEVKAAKIDFWVDKSIADAPKFRQEVFARPKTVLPSGRIAFGMVPDRSFTNEIAVIVERNGPPGGETGFAEQPGRFTWKWGSAPTALNQGYRYHNRLAIGLASAVSGKPMTNLLGQRVYHWINYLDRSATEHWYPTDRQIDQMADNGATMLVLHQDWMLHSGSNGKPHADYTTARHEPSLRRVIEKAHERSMRVGLYRRGIERYSLGQVFGKYLKRNWDGFYVDWHGPHAVAEHEMNNRPDPAVNDKHYSEAGELLAARDYFQFARDLRDIVGPGGFLIGHMGFGSAGVFANFHFDAFLPGESARDHTMFATRDDAVFRGMTCGTVCMPWPADSRQFTTPEGVAKMAAWGFYPHVCLGLQRRADATLFPLDPDAPANAFALGYWRVLSKIDVESADAFNLPNQSRAAMRSSNPAVDGVVYAEDKNGRRDYLVVIANLSSQPAQATLEFDPKVLGMSGTYRAARIDSQSGSPQPHAMHDNRIDTPQLPPWCVMGFKLEPTEGRRAR